MFKLRDKVSFIKRYITAHTGFDPSTFKIRAQSSRHGKWFVMADFESLEDIDHYHEFQLSPAIGSNPSDPLVHLHVMEIEMLHGNPDDA